VAREKITSSCAPRIASVRSNRARKLLVHAREARERIASVRSWRTRRLPVHAREARERIASVRS
jgi:hypothetical protein